MELILRPRFTKIERSEGEDRFSIIKNLRPKS
jgi:hypothetical protein